MHDIWNPWHGCVKCSEGCENCYMYFLDRVRNRNGADIYKTAMTAQIVGDVSIDFLFWLCYTYQS